MKTGKFVKILPLFLIIFTGCYGVVSERATVAERATVGKSPTGGESPPQPHQTNIQGLADASGIACSEREGLKLEVYLLKGELVGVKEENGRLVGERDDLRRRVEKYLSLRCWCKHKGVLIGMPFVGKTPTVPETGTVPLEGGPGQKP